MSEENDVVGGAVDSPERRDFLVKAGRFAVVTPVAVTVLLSTSMDAKASHIFKSGGQPQKDHHKKYREKYLKLLKKLQHKKYSRKFFARFWS